MVNQYKRKVQVPERARAYQDSGRHQCCYSSDFTLVFVASPF